MLCEALWPRDLLQNSCPSSMSTAMFPARNLDPTPYFRFLLNLLLCTLYIGSAKNYNTTTLFEVLTDLFFYVCCSVPARKSRMMTLLQIFVRLSS